MSGLILTWVTKRVFSISKGLLAVNIVQAINWAIDQGVNIINLSLGFPEQSSHGLRRALERANYENIAVFAAAANHGNCRAIAWPARDPDLAICVTSADESYKCSLFAPSAAGRDLPMFITHGEKVVSHWPIKLGQGSFRAMSGTSVATPIAVGMAAMILAFLNKTNVWEDKEKWLGRSNEGKLRSTMGMRHLLQHMCRERDGLNVLSPSLMWEEDANANPLRVLSDMAQPFRRPG